MHEYTYDEIEIAMNFKFTEILTNDKITNFYNITGDKNPLHTNDEFAKTSQFGQKVVFGLLTQCFLSKLVGMYLPGKYCLILSVNSNFKEPAFIDDEIEISGEVVQKIDSMRCLKIKSFIKRISDGVTLIESNIMVKVLK